VYVYNASLEYIPGFTTAIIIVYLVLCVNCIVHFKVHCAIYLCSSTTEKCTYYCINLRSLYKRIQGQVQVGLDRTSQEPLVGVRR